ncbi:hypothetical protein ACIBCO_38165 [Streptomyces violascens]|uniref:hypothetical protein n=1 Tax=Streptomyces violascens TaxID=67381 RepID=UPI00378AB1D9
MSPSTARAADTSRMDEKNEFRAEITGIRGQRLRVGEALYRKRQRLNEPVLAERPGRPRRVAGYVLVTFGEATADVEQMLRMEADRRGWHMTRVFVDPASALPLDQRDHWQAARDYVLRGFADGLIVLHRRHISADDDEYVAELETVCGRRAFVTLVVPETEV